MPFCGRDPGILVRQVEIFSIGILNARLIARLPCRPLEESFQPREGLKSLFTEGLVLLTNVYHGFVLKGRLNSFRGVRNNKPLIIQGLFVLVAMQGIEPRTLRI